MRNRKNLLIVVVLTIGACLNIWASTQPLESYSLKEFKSSHQLADPPTLSVRSSETIDDTDVFTYNVSYINADVVKVFNDVKNLHKPGGSIAFDLSPFEVNESTLTLKVGIKKGILDQNGLMNYIQKQLNYALRNQ